ncbi:hypothetical protein [Kitasatospora cheerisanensis]|uniref:ATP-binding protein n=1 Tax=Kitasatospora cheerisanensis KCTC 2395 TaxID=1348663 RepID=A0A066Z3Z3_9ACTN|nr:hypothetical protein [Kitasatospora cheerisanensis]KDN85066.1 hypothetical protein KCH_31650 [Kitasatospora cheerisanensis KCTC 2395]
MKQATLKAAGTAVLGVVAAAVAAGTASAAPVAPGGLGLPTGALTNPGVTGAATGAVSKLPGADQLGTVTGALNPAAGNAAPGAASAASEQAQPVAEHVGPGGVDPKAVPAAEAAPRVGGLDAIPGGQGLAKTPVGSVVGTLSGLTPTGGGAPGLPGLPGLGG